MTPSNPPTTPPESSTGDTKSEILDVKIAQTLDDMYLYTDDEKYHVAQIRVLIEAEATRRVVEALKKLEAQLPRHFSPEDEDNPGFSGTWHLDTYKLAIEDCRSDIKEAIRIAQLTQEKNND